MSDQFCPICCVSVEPNVRYKNYICFECCAKAVDEKGRKLGFGNESFSGGFVAWYADTNETARSIANRGKKATLRRTWRIVIRLYDERMRQWYTTSLLRNQ